MDYTEHFRITLLESLRVIHPSDVHSTLLCNYLSLICTKSSSHHPQLLAWIKGHIISAIATSDYTLPKMGNFSDDIRTKDDISNITHWEDPQVSLLFLDTTGLYLLFAIISLGPLLLWYSFYLPSKFDRQI